MRGRAPLAGLWVALAAVAASINDCAVPLGRRPIHEIDRVSTVICNVSALNGGLIVVGSTPPERGEDWWYGISHDDEVVYTSNVNRARYDISRGCRVNNDRLYIPKRRGAGVGVWAITTGHHINDLSLGCPHQRDPHCWVTELEVCDGVLFLAVATDQGKHLQAMNATSGRKLWTYDFQNVTEPRLRASPAQDCVLWTVYVPQRKKRDRGVPREPVVQAFRRDGGAYFTAALSGALMVTQRAYTRLSPAGDLLGVVFASTSVKDWMAAREPVNPQPSTLMDCLWVVDTSGAAAPRLLFYNPAGAKPPAIRFGATSDVVYFQSNKMLHVVPLDDEEEMMQFRGAVGPYYIDRLQNIYFVKKDSGNVRLWKVQPDGDVAWHRDVDHATSVLMVCGGTAAENIHLLMTRPRNRSALVNAPQGQLMDVLFLHATRTDHDCSPLFPQSNPVDMALGVATGAGAVCLILLALYLYRRVTYAR
eukprot:EG_transcript_11594